MKFIHIFLTTLSLPLSFLYAGREQERQVLHNRTPIKNYVSVDAFRSIADFTFENECFQFWVYPSTTKYLNMQAHKIAAHCKPGDIIYVESCLIDEFLSLVHPNINHPYILISHFGINIIDHRYKDFLDSDKIIRWYAHNINLQHAKLIAIPLGIESRYWISKRVHNYEQILDQCNSYSCKRRPTIYMNFALHTFKKERTIADNHFKSFKDSFYQKRVGYKQYLHDLKGCQFTPSPSGAGISCLRTWEALLMDCIPIVRPVCLDTGEYAEGYDDLYKDLPVILIREWEEVTEEFLAAKLEEFRSRKFKMEKIYFPYWKNLIFEEKAKFLANPYSVQ
ncbi:hypothetical protein K0U07_03555 [bacterium]|nr:hypothetical protein [bacterium]